MMLKELTCAAVVLLANTCAIAQAKNIAVDQEHAVVIDDVIMNGNILPLGDVLLSAADNKVGTVDIVINSPGGSVTTGFMFISMMDEARARGLKLRCFVPEIAASMAFGILVHCDERHALAKSFLLWHRARVNMGGMGSQPMTAPQLLVLGRDLESLDKLIFEETDAALSDLSTANVMYHFETETLHVGSNLAAMAPSFIKSHTSIDGLYETLRNEKVPHPRRSSPFGFSFNKDTFIYIHETFTRWMRNNSIGGVK